MGTWTFVGYAVQALIASLVLTVLTWAAIERARIHQYARHAPGHEVTPDSRRLSIWRVLREALRALPRSHRLHLALGAVGGCV
jgi:hypothetical protein